MAPSPAEISGALSCYWLKVSAKTSEALGALAERYAAALEDASPTMNLSSASLEDICFAANTGRSDFAHRGVVQFSTRLELIERLRQLADVRSQRNALFFAVVMSYRNQRPLIRLLRRSRVGCMRCSAMCAAKMSIGWSCIARPIPGDAAAPCQLARLCLQRQRCWFKPNASANAVATRVQFCHRRPQRNSCMGAFGFGRFERHLRDELAGCRKSLGIIVFEARASFRQRVSRTGDYRGMGLG